MVWSTLDRGRLKNRTELPPTDIDIDIDYRRQGYRFNPFCQQNSSARAPREIHTMSRCDFRAIQIHFFTCMYLLTYLTHGHTRRCIDVAKDLPPGICGRGCPYQSVRWSSGQHAATHHPSPSSSSVDHRLIYDTTSHWLACRRTSTNAQQSRGVASMEKMEQPGLYLSNFIRGGRSFGY